ncbi:MAG: biopolymer transporter ExbD [Firmicutes bacterium]|nr:biopolymer transporter ExbD [Bacillota bacterium]
MEFKRSQRSKRYLGGRPEIAPMIDVIFFLLIFFMLFSSLRETATSIDVELPQAVSDTAQHTSTFEVTVSREGDFYINSKKVTGVELQEALKKAVAQNPNVFVIIKGDKYTDFENVINAMDHAGQIGIDDIGLAVFQVIP